MDPPLEIGERAAQVRDPLVHRVQPALLDVEAVQAPLVLVLDAGEPGHLLRAVLLGGLLGRSHFAGPRLDPPDQLLQVLQRVLGLLDVLGFLLELLRPCVQVPDLVVEPGELRGRAIRHFPLLLENAGLVGDMIGQRIERLDVLLRPGRQLLHLGQVGERHLVAGDLGSRFLHVVLDAQRLFAQLGDPAHRLVLRALEVVLLVAGVIHVVAIGEELAAQVVELAAHLRDRPAGGHGRLQLVPDLGGRSHGFLETLRHRHDVGYIGVGLGDLAFDVRVVLLRRRRPLGQLLQPFRQRVQLPGTVFDLLHAGGDLFGPIRDRVERRVQLFQLFDRALGTTQQGRNLGAFFLGLLDQLLQLLGKLFQRRRSRRGRFLAEEGHR